MRRACLLLCLAAVLGGLAITGCKDYPEPVITRVSVRPACGVAPLEVEAFATASGGDESGDPTGANNNTDITWDFGDDETGTQTLDFHTYADPGEYTVKVTVTDPDGKTASDTVHVSVLVDSLTIQASSDFPDGAVTTADIVNFDVWAKSCEIDPDNVGTGGDDIGDYTQLTFRWEMNDALENVFYGKTPAFQFTAPGTYQVDLTVVYPAWAVTRRDQLTFIVTDP